MGWLWEAMEELMEEGQDWIVVVLVGESFHLSPLFFLRVLEHELMLLLIRHGNRTQRRLDLHLYRMALVSQARTLHLWLVVEREVLLLGSRFP